MQLFNFTSVLKYAIIIQVMTAFVPICLQEMPATYHGPVKKQSFIQHMKDLIEDGQDNAQIPPKSPKHLRVATFNIHFFADIHMEPNFALLEQDLYGMEADIILFQEVSYLRPAELKEFEGML